MGLKDIISFWILLELTDNVMCQCSGTTLVLSAGESPARFISPGYPTSYTDNLTCAWLIDSGVAGQRIMLYSEFMNMDCALGDFVNIYNGQNSSAATLQTNLCAASNPSNEFISSGRFVYITFTTNGAGVSQGFEMTYLTAADTSASGCTAQYTLQASTTAQYLTSEGFPSLYSSLSSCRWLIQASTTLSTINVQLVWSDIEVDPDCIYDVLIIYDGRYVCENQELIINCTSRTSADATPAVFTSTGDSVLVKFTSDSSYNRYGFIIKYSENFVNYTTTTAAPSTSAAIVNAAQSDSNTETAISIPLMAASAVAGAVFILGVFATIWLVKYIKARKRVKKGVIHVHAIAPLPARTVFQPRQATNVLSFV